MNPGAGLPAGRFHAPSGSGRPDADPYLVLLASGATWHGWLPPPANQDCCNEINASEGCREAAHPIVRHRANYYETEHAFVTRSAPELPQKCVSARVLCACVLSCFMTSLNSSLDCSRFSAGNRRRSFWCRCVFVVISEAKGSHHHVVHVHVLVWVFVHSNIKWSVVSLICQISSSH